MSQSDRVSDEHSTSEPRLIHFVGHLCQPHHTSNFQENAHYSKVIVGHIQGITSVPGNKPTRHD